MGTLDRAIARSAFLMARVVLERGRILEWGLFCVTTLAALSLSSVSGVASHRNLLSVAESLLVLYLWSEESLVRNVRDRRTHVCAFEKTG